MKDSEPKLSMAFHTGAKTPGWGTELATRLGSENTCYSRVTDAFFTLSRP